MSLRRILPFLPLPLLLPPLAPGQTAGTPNTLSWPAPTQTSRPWTRWWWLGSAVDAPNLQSLLTQYRDAGMGGVEICPIYGAKGYESRFIPYLSPKWMEMFGATTQFASKLGIGVDLTTGTGWPNGGPWVSTEMASESVSIERYALGDDGKLPASFGAAPRVPTPGAPADAKGVVKMDGLLTGSPGAAKLLCLMAVGPDGARTDLTPLVKDGRVDWTAPGPGWKVYALNARQPVQKVKRAAPGGEGNVVDPYSTAAIDAYLSRFDQAFQGYAGLRPRSMFHDSFEYFAANWTPDFFAEFAAHRGYDLREHLAELAGDGNADTAARVREDYRRTIGELHLAYITRWTEWSHSHGSLTREQAHGAPANIEDVYAAADIPETEGAFGGGTDDQIPMMKFASSAAHTTGRALASSETFTWLGEHFQVPLAQLKPAVDRFYLAGINHIFFQGIPYSPADAPWPGWLFYAAVHFGPNGGIWHDLPAFNAYATRCQSILQSGKPDNDVLLYFPVADFWQRSGPPPGARAAAARGGRASDPLVEQFTTPGAWMLGTPFHKLAMQLWGKGYGYDEVTDDLLMKAKVERSAADLADAPIAIDLGGSTYSAIVIPQCKYLPVETLWKLLDLARAGATIVFQGEIPSDVPGFGNLDARRTELRNLRDAAPGRQGTAPFGAGRIWVGGASGNPDDSVLSALAAAGVSRERMTDSGLQFVRRKREDGTDYFIVNKGSATIDTWVPIARNAASAALFDPLLSDRIGFAATRNGKNGAEVFLQMSPGDSLILRTYAREAPGGPAWNYLRAGAEPPRALTGEWTVHFTEGGPALPGDFRTSNLGSWTDRDDPDAKRFAGTAVYRLEFDMPAGSLASGGAAAREWRLDLGKVAESARVRLNGGDVTTLWCPPFSANVGRFLKEGSNVLEVEVTNVAANRIRDLDQRKVSWKSFYEINFVNFNYRPFDASGWPIRPSGLLGPVTIAPESAATPD
ncbi:MAG: glycosyl hydrolase [Opitutaceae bacterium]